MKSVIVKKREADGTSGTSGRYESSPLIAIYYDWTIVFFVGRANDLLSATGEINPSLTLSVLMLGGKSDKGNGAQWDKEESLTHLLTWWSTAAICPYLRRAGAMAEAHWPTEGSRGLQSWRPFRGEKQDPQAHDNIQQPTLSTCHLTNIDSTLMLCLSFNY